MNPLPPPNRIPTNCDEIGTVFPCEGYSVYSWGPERDGRGPKTQVHLLLPISGVGSIALRLKSKCAVDEMIAALTRHRNDVWPG